jgi:hypothetical protein
MLRTAVRAIVILTMAKPTSKQQNYSWAVYRIRGTPAQLIGIVDDQPDEETAIKKAIEEFKVPRKPARPADRSAAGLSNGLAIWRGQLPKAGIPELTLPWSLSSNNSVRYCEACLPDDGALHAGSSSLPSSNRRTRALPGCCRSIYVTWDSPSGRSLTTLRKVFDQFGTSCFGLTKT